MGLAVAAVIGAATAPACTLLLPSDSELSTSSSSTGATGGAAASSSSSSGAAGGGGGQATGGADSGLPGCHGHGKEKYDVYWTFGFTPDTADIDAGCSDFGGAKPIVFQGECSSDNGIACRLVWDKNDDQHVFGCCEVSDRELWTISDASAENADPSGDVWDWWEDDAFEYFLSAKPGDAGFGDASVKVALDLNGRKYDAIIVNEQDGEDAGYNGNTTFYRRLYGSLNHNGGKPDQGYVLKWDVHYPFKITDGMNAGCDFVLYDRDYPKDGGGDADAAVTKAYAYGGGSSFNAPQNWGTCIFHAQPPP
jgi:hypothetical protein